MLFRAAELEIGEEFLVLKTRIGAKETGVTPM
jgi:hypothetical protein